MISNKLTFFIFVLIPSIISGVYYLNFASDKFVSESRFIIQGSDQSSEDVLGAVTGLGLAGVSSSTTDSLTVLSYSISHEFIAEILPDINLFEHYSDDRHDWWARLHREATKEELLEYWDREIINISYDATSGISILEVTAFDPEVAQRLSNLILQLNEKFINGLSSEAQSDTLKFAQDEVIKAEAELLIIRSKLAMFSEKEKVISAEQSAEAEQGIVESLKQLIATKEAELKSLSSFMQSNSLKVKSLANEIDSLKKQTVAQQSNWALPSNGKTVARLVLDTEQLKSELAFAEQIYLTSLSSLKQAQIKTDQKQRYLNIIVPPHLPDESTEPERVYSIFTVFLSSLMLWGIFTLIFSAIKDNLGWT